MLTRPHRHEARAVMAFVERYVHLIRRYLGWELVFLSYTCVNTVTIALIGGGDGHRTMYLMVGAVLWGFLSLIFQELADTITWERWEGTLEYTFMAPVRRVTHLLGMCVSTVLLGILRTIVILLVVSLFMHMSLAHANLGAAVVVLVVSSISFIGLGMLAAVLPLLSHEKGCQATHIVQALLLLVSGVYYEITVLPAWVQPLSWFSPATYTLRAMRAALLEGAGLMDVLPALAVLGVMGMVLVPLGLWVFHLGEQHARRNGMLSRCG